MALDDLHRHLARQTLQALRTLLAVVFGINRQTNVLIERVVQHERAEILDRVERITAAADDRTHVRTRQLKAQLVALGLRKNRDLTLDAHLLHQTGDERGRELLRLLHAVLGDRDELALLRNGRSDRALLARTALTARAVAAFTARSVAALAARTLDLELFRNKIRRSSLDQTRRVVLVGDGQLLRLDSRLFCLRLGLYRLRSRLFRLRRRFLLLDDLGRLIGHADARRGRTNAENALFAVVEYLYGYIIAVEAQLTQRVCNSYITALAGCF